MPPYNKFTDEGVLNMTNAQRTIMATLALAVATTAMAGQSPDPRGLPACTMQGNPDACRLQVKDGDFSEGSLGAWRRTGMPAVGYDASGNAYAAIPVGSSVAQAVAINTGTRTADATYVIRFRALAESADGSVDVRVALSDDTASEKVSLGGTSAAVKRGEWTDVELFVEGKPWSVPPHVFVSIANTSMSGSVVQVDDVYVIESVSAGT